MSSRDYEEFLASLNARDVRYLVVGAHAVAFHARPRSTKDLDLFVEPESGNAERTLAAIRDFLGSDLGLTLDDLMDPDTVVQLGVAPSRIDLLAALEEIRDFSAAWETRAEGSFAEVPTQYLSLDDLLREKEGSKREQDRADAKFLRRAKKRRS